MNRIPTSTTLLFALISGQSIACACVLRSVEIGPVTAENADTYHGQSAGVEVLFHNDVQGRPVTVFPEPPMTVRRLTPPGECVVSDGGVWGRDGVWLSADGRTLVTTESSGSYEGLVFRDTRSCAKVGELDVSGATWKVEGRSLVLRHADNRGRAKRVLLDATCRPAPQGRPRR